MNKVCSHCGIKKINNKIHYLRQSPNFTWDKPHPWQLPSFFFCSQECKWNFIKIMKKLNTESLPYLAELDESMNYCEYFERTNWNEWIYRKDWFEFEVNWLWDYKSFNRYNKWSLNFKEAFVKYFWNFNRFKLHNRYLIQ